MYSGEKSNDSVVDEELTRSKWSGFYEKYRFFFHIFIGAVFTAWCLVAIFEHRDLGWLMHFLVSVLDLVLEVST